MPAAKIVAKPAAKSAQAGKPKTGKSENKKVDATKPETKKAVVKGDRTAATGK